MMPVMRATIKIPWALGIFSIFIKRGRSVNDQAQFMNQLIISIIIVAGPLLFQNRPNIKAQNMGIDHENSQLSAPRIGGRKEAKAMPDMAMIRITIRLTFLICTSVAFGLKSLL